MAALDPPTETKRRLPDWMRARLDEGQRFLILCILIGLCCGVAAVLFHLSIHHLFEGLWHWASSKPEWQMITIMIGAPTLAGLIVGLAVKFLAPEALGSGIPQTKSSYYNNSGRIPLMAGFWRFTLGSLYCGLGNSLGREGPTVHMSAAIASRLGRWLFIDPHRVCATIPVGMAAGIAAAFNAPLSAITFVFEELLDNFSMKSLGGIVISVVIAAAVGRTLLGEDPVVATHLIDESFQTSPWMLVGIPLGLLAGFLGHFFVSSVLKTRSFFKGKANGFQWLHPAFGGLCCGIIGIAALYLTGAFGEAQNTVFSIGYESLESAFEAKLVIQVLAILLVLKFVAVVLNYATGGSGGLFSPTLFLGGMLGGIVGTAVTLLQHYIDIPAYPGHEQVIGGSVLLGMGAMFSSVIRCPFTSLIIIFEMTGNYSLILPLMAGNMLAWSISKRLQPVALYDSLLLQDGISLKRFHAYRGSQDYRNLPVAAIMTHEVQTLCENDSVDKVLSSMPSRRCKFHGYPITNSEGELIGIVTRHELEETEDNLPLSHFLHKQELLTVTPDTAIRDAANRMIAKNFQQVPVVSPTNAKKLLGWITLNDIARQQNASEI